jgi:hypothetical protein
MYHLTPIQGIRYQADGFNKADPDQHHYALVLHATGYALIITRKETGDIELAYRTIDNKGKELGLELLTKHIGFWKGMNLTSIPGELLHAESKFTLAPGLVKDDQLIATLFGFNHKMSNDLLLHTIGLDNIDANLIYSTGKEITEFVRKHLPLVSQSHMGASLLQQHNSLSKLPCHETSTAIYSTSQSLIVHVIQKGKTTLLNSLPYRSTNDLLYFLAALAAHDDLQSGLGPMWIMGVVDEDHAAIEQIKKYIPRITYATGHPNDKVLPEGEKHCFQLLLHHLSCVS